MEVQSNREPVPSLNDVVKEGGMHNTTCVFLGFFFFALKSLQFRAFLHDATISSKYKICQAGRRFINIERLPFLPRIFLNAVTSGQAMKEEER